MRGCAGEPEERTPILGACLYLAALRRWSSVGVLTSRDLVFLWFAAGMAAFSVTDLRRRIRAS
jgi:hypothetical protein